MTSRRCCRRSIPGTETRRSRSWACTMRSPTRATGRAPRRWASTWSSRWRRRRRPRGRRLTRWARPRCARRSRRSIASWRSSASTGPSAPTASPGARGRNRQHRRCAGRGRGRRPGRLRAGSLHGADQRAEVVTALVRADGRRRRIGVRSHRARVGGQSDRRLRDEVHRRSAARARRSDAAHADRRAAGGPAQAQPGGAGRGAPDRQRTLHAGEPPQAWCGSTRARSWWRTLARWCRTPRSRQPRSRRRRRCWRCATTCGSTPPTEIASRSSPDSRPPPERRSTQFAP